MATNPINSTNNKPPVPEGSGRALQDVNTDDFLKLMIAEMQNQDPLNPMDNAQILQQISQIRSVEASTKMTETLNSVLQGQHLSNAGTMINKTVEGLSDDGEFITGRVESVLLQGDKPRLVLADGVVKMENIISVFPEDA